MDVQSTTISRIHRFFGGGIDIVEYIGLVVVAIATTLAMYQEVADMFGMKRVQLADLLMMFLYLEVLAMVGQYFKSGHLPVRYPLYIAIVALARYLLIDLKEMSELRVIAVAAAIFVLSVAVLVIRYGHKTFPYLQNVPTKKDPDPAFSPAHIED